MTENEHQKKARDVLRVLDDTIEQGPWNKSTFLGAVGKKLKDIRFGFKNRLRFLDPSFEEAITSVKIESPIAAPPTKTDNQIEAFVSLYNADGGNLEKWEKILYALGRQIVTRPVYGTEKEIRAVMRAKAFVRNDAYAAFYVDKEDIIPPRDGKPPVDRLGNVLLILKDTALKNENITRFCHESGSYLFKNNTLTRIGDMTFMDN